MRTRLRSALAMVGTFALIASLASVLTTTVSASAAQPSDPGPAALPSVVPAANTPNVDDGGVYAIADIGATVVIGGTFTSVGGTARRGVAAFDKATGALLPGFAPTVDGDVNAVIAGPTANTVYIGGTFTQVNGTAAKFLALLDLSDGSLVPTFKPPTFNYGYVNDLVKRGNRLYVAGVFTAAAGKTHQGLVSLDATTGALDPFMNIQLSGHHNDSGSGAQAWVGATDIDVTANGSTMVVIGNFKFADGQVRDQVALIDLTGPSAVLSTWSTTGYSPYCSNWAFDQYVRGVSFSPDGTFFAVNATGGPHPGTLCDATARWNVSTTPDSQPVWVDETGGDTTWGVTVTNHAIYIGGHFRWENNPNGSDNARAGAAPRPGVAALDVATGRPFAWNPGHVPLGVSAFAFLGTSDGVWMGYDEDYIGNYQYRRQKIAFFPYAGGYEPASTAVNQLPGTVYLAGNQVSGSSNVLYRVNAGGPALASLDSGPDWTADTSDPSPYHNSGTTVNAWGSQVGKLDNTVPSSTPPAVYTDDRSTNNDNPPLKWTFPVATGTPLQVRLYFANRCGCTKRSFQRVFNVSIDGTKVLSNYDIVRSVGNNVGTMRSFSLTSDGVVNIDFSRVISNPVISAIEIVRTDLPGPTTADNGLSAVAFDGTTASAATADNQGIDFGNWRGAFVVGATVYYGYTDGYLYSRSFDGTTFGPAVKIDPYNDPTWSDVVPYSGSPTLRGMVPTWYSQLKNITAMTYYQGRVYYTLLGDSHLYSKWFLPDSGVIDETTLTQISSVDLSQADGMFVSDGTLYYGSRSDGNLRKVAFGGGNPTGTATVVSGPAVDGVRWQGRAVFVGQGTRPNAAPTASFSSECTSLRCAFDGRSSSDSDGSVASYAWDFGDGSTGTGATPTHTYADNGTYHVTLTVTDDQGAASAALSRSVSVTNAVPTAAFTAGCAALVCSFDGSGSADSDGSVASYAWNFGDGTTGTGATPGHTYGSAGTYTVTLTVTDDVGAASAPLAKTVTVKAQQTSVQFVGAGNAGGGNVKVKQVAIPDAAQAGDTAIMMLSQNATSVWTGPSGVTGWTQLDSYTNGALLTTVWLKRLEAGDLGASVRFDSSTYTHAAVDLAVYRGVDSATPVSAFAHSGDAGGTSHVTPTAPADAGDFVVSLWGDRASSAVTWSAPAGQVARDASPDSGSLTLQGLVSDPDAPATAGDAGGVSATTDVATARTAMWTLVLNPAGSVTPPPAAQGVQFVAGANAGGGNATVKQLKVPSAAAAGDTALLFLSQATTSTWTGPSGVTGWTQVDSYTNGGLLTTLWIKRLDAADVGATVRFDSAAYSHASEDLVVYSGVDATTPIADLAYAGDAGGTTHVTPTATAGDGDLPVSLWTLRASGTRTWAAPADTVVRDVSTDTGSATVESLIADPDRGASAGPVGGLTATTDDVTSRTEMWTIVLNAA